MRFLDNALSLDGTLNAKEVRKRTTFFIFFMISFWSTLLGLVTLSYNAESYLWANLTTLAGYAFIVMYILCKGPLTLRFCMCSFTLVGGFILTADVHMRTTGNGGWVLLILVIDILLVMQVPTAYSTGAVAITLVWLVVMSLEESLRFGILDLPGLRPQEGPGGRREYIIKKMDCEMLPCPVDWPPSNLLLSAAVFLVDFIVTRGFAREVLKEQAAMEKTIEAVQEIASLLAKYDVEGVARMLKMLEEELPEQMYETLHSLEQNLRMYRPYLPAALFEEMEEEDGEGADGDNIEQYVAPGLTTETATIVFTDILSSTSIWEHAPEGMRAGLKIHNSVMRKAMSLFGGYEVKTIGDAFMVAFSTTQDGVNFGLHVHELLRDASWPASLLEDAPICAEQGSLWGGLTVRIGVNTGPITVEQNTLTGRTDYFGHTVNVASRLESTCKPGAVAIPSDLYTSECRSCSAVVGDAEALVMRGVSGTTFVVNMWSASLAGRKESPLREAYPIKTKSGSLSEPCESHGSTSCSSSLASFDAHALSMQGVARLFDATTAVVELVVGEEGNPSALRYMSASLSTLTVALDQSRGTLVTLLGNRVCVGWNLTRSAPAHMENALRFGQNLLVSDSLSGAALVSGRVQHGDVGARKQRFVTVMGRTVHRSWALCDEAVRGGGLCLFEPPVDTVLPLALEDVVVQIKSCADVYRVLAPSTLDY